MIFSIKYYPLNLTINKRHLFTYKHKGLIINHLNL